MTRNPVILPIGMARCPATRTDYCGRADQCARALVDGVGRYSQDFSIEPRGPGSACAHFIDADSHRPAPVPVERKSHDSLVAIERRGA